MIAPSAAVPYDQEMIGRGELKGGRADASTFLAKLANDPATELVEQLMSATPDPIAQKYPSLGPEERYSKVVEAE